MLKQKKILFIDRDGTLIEEPNDFQIDHIDKLALMPNVIPALLRLIQAGYSLVMISNQDGLGTKSFPTKSFQMPHDFMLRIFASQGILFEAIRICPHFYPEGCECRKPKLSLITDYIINQSFDLQSSFVIGDRETDIEFANNLGIKGLHLDKNFTWNDIANYILLKTRSATITRKTNETDITISVNLDSQSSVKVNTGIHFFNHMLEQLAKHAGINLDLLVKGDLHIDEHHTVEDTAIVLGEAIRKALGDKMGIGRYGFLLPMDEALAQVAIDLSGRAYFVFNGEFKREIVGDLATELITHFFRSFADGLKATLHIDVQGENNHHMIEAIFKGVGRTLRQAIQKIDTTLPSTKGLL